MKRVIQKVSGISVVLILTMTITACQSYYRINEDKDIVQTTLTTSEETNTTEMTEESTQSEGYDLDKLSDMAWDYYAKHNDGYRPSNCSYEDNHDGTVTIHLYDDMGDHVATCAWYTIDVKTAKGQDDIFFTEVDLND